jgi:CheY-like chemotaxis protein
MIDLREKHAAPAEELLGVRVLVVDDDLGICQSVKEILETAGCVVTTANDGAEGLRRVESQPLDVVLSDVVMPEMDGYELYTTMRKTHPELPVLMMTGFHYDRYHVIKRSRLEGLEGVIFKKPVDPNRLIEVIRETVAQRKAGVLPG